MSFAFVTLLSSDNYLPGALVLVASLRELHPTPPRAPEDNFKTICLVTPETVDVKSIKALRKAYDVVIGVEILESENNARGLQLLGRPDLNTVLTKLHVFRLTEFSKIVFLDADVLPLQPISHLFLTPHEFSASPDVGWPDIFNSGCMVLEPGEDKFQQLIDLVKTKGSWDGGDQGLLNEWRGGNWNRLSFTYNTTPTAAYTYAPAYERFGSTIKAIHFIGQNKPWVSIPWRAPIEHPSAESMNSYGYSNLVDRWFAVYDRNYRPPVVATEEEYLRQQYTPAWGVSASEPGTQGLGLDELRKLAIEGVATSTSAFTGTSGDGEYKSMPLDGRIDLMRPRPVETGAPSQESAGATSDANMTGGSTGQDVHDGGYRPPGREGLPSYLYQPPPPVHHDHVPAPPEQSHHLQEQEDLTPRPIQHHIEHPPWSQDQQDTQPRQGGPTHQEYRPPSPPLISWDPAKEPPPHNPPPVGAAMAFTDQQYQNVWDLPPSYPPHHQPHHQYGYQPHWTETTHQGHGHHQDPWRGPQSPQHPANVSPSQNGRHQEPWFGQHSHSPSHQANGVYHDPSKGQDRRGSPDRHHHRHHHHHHHHHQQQQQQQHHHHHQERHQHQTYHQHHGSSASRPYQPPSHGIPGQPYPGPPHHDQPYPDTYRGQQYQQWTGTPHQSHPHQTRPEDFFHAPAPSQIPSRLIDEGHYKAVMTSDPRPDSTKVEPIFPWERRSRPAPSRVFPDWEAKPPVISGPQARGTAVISPPPEYAPQAPAPRPISPPPPPHVKRKFNPPPSPPKRQGSIYSNAWDVDYGIQRYAAILQGKPGPISPMPWPAHPGQDAYAAKKKGKGSPDREEEEQEFTVWAEKAEASSRDGDDEDDEEEESPVLSPMSAARRRAAKAKGKSYRHQGVQTEPKKTEERGVQVSISTVPSKRPYEFGSSAQQRPQKQSFGMQHSPPAISGRYSPLQHRQEYMPNRDEILGDSSFLPSAEITALAATVVGGGDFDLPLAKLIRKRESSEDSVTTAAESSIIASPQKEINEMGTPRIGITVPEPMEQPAITARPGLSSEGSVRRAGRVFSPTTGVDIFKRGSEEVLARFLMQQPPGWDAARHASPGPPTPSAIH